MSFDNFCIILSYKNESFFNVSKIAFGVSLPLATSDDQTLPIYNEYCLKAGIANYRAEKPISKAFLTDIEFDMDNMISQSEPGQLEVTAVQNRGSIPQTVTREISYTTASSESYSSSRSLALDVSVKCCKRARAFLVRR